MYCLSLTWRILSITLRACEISTIVWEFEHSLALPIFGIGMKTDLFQSCGHCRVFQSCWHIDCSTLTTSSFRIWNSSAGIPSPPLTLFILMLPKAYLTSKSRMSGSRWMTTPLRLSGSLRPFLYSSVYFCHLFLIASASVRSLSFLSLPCPSLHEMFPLYLQFSWRDCCSFTFYCFPLFLCIGHIRRLSFLSLQLGIPFPFSFAFCFSFFSQLFVKTPQTTHVRFPK